MNKNFKRLLIASLAVGFVNFSPIVLHENNLQIVSVAYAEIQTVIVSGSAGMSFGDNDEKIINMVKAAAKMNAVQAAKEKAGVYVKSLSKTVNGRLTDDDISAYTSNNVKIISETYKKDYYNESDLTGNLTGNVGFKYIATVTAEIDTSDLQNYVRRDEKEKYTLAEQVKYSQKNIEEINKNIEDLSKTAKNKTSEEIQVEVQKIDNEVLAQQKVDEGIKLLYKGDNKSAILKFNEAIELNPNNASAYNGRGRAYHGISVYEKFIDKNSKVYLINYDKAIEDFNKAIQIDPNYSDAYMGRGFTYYILAKDYNKAFDDLNKAIQLNPNNLQAYVFRSLYYRQILKNNDLGLKDLNKALEIDPNYVHGYINRATFYKSDLKDFNSAINDLTTAIKIDPTYAMAYHNRGEIYSSLKLYDMAIEDFNRAIEFETNEEMLIMNYYSRGEVYLEKKDYGNAIQDFTKFIQSVNDKSSGKILLKYVYKYRGECYKAIGENEKANADFAKAK